MTDDVYDTIGKIIMFPRVESEGNTRILGTSVS